MASPHVAGVAALYLQDNASAAPATVASAIVSTAFTSKLSGIGTGSPNRLLNSLLAVPLSVSLSCGLYMDFGGYGTHVCDAYGSGGSGEYSYSWTNAYEFYYAGYWSQAEVDCYAYGYGFNWPVDVWVTVTDSDGRTASASRTVPCSRGW
jgi:hypothetical protein